MSQSSQVEVLRQLFKNNELDLIEDLFSFLKIPSVSSEPDHHDDTIRCAEWVENFLTDTPIELQRWETSGFPVIFGSWNGAGPDKPTVLIYNHYDVQPVDPIELWESPPFEPTLRHGVVYARGAQDNKGQCFYVLSLIRALFQSTGTLPVNIKLLVEGEEEVGSTGLAEILHERADALQADQLLVVDLGFAKRGNPAVTLGMRGMATMTVKLTGSSTDLHSGSHGGLVYNPNHALVDMLAKMRDSTGKIAIPGVYDNVQPLTDEDRQSIDFSFEQAEYEAMFSAAPTGGERDLTPLESAWTRPTLEINGIAGGYHGEGFKTVIPARAIAKLSLRLVPNQDPKRLQSLVKSFVEKNTPKGITAEVILHPGVGLPVRTKGDSTAIKACQQAFSEVNNTECRFILEGASVPIVAELSQASGADVALIGYGLPTDNMHAPNENFDLERVETGFVTIGRILQILGEK